MQRKSILAFEELMGVIKLGPPSPGHHGTEDLMESGLAHSDASDSDNEIFENAMESLHLGKRSLQKEDRPTICRFKSMTF